MQEEDIKASILRKLFVMKKIGASHTPKENIQKSFPKHIRGEIKKKVIPKLIKEKLLLLKKHNYGDGVSLNPGKIKEVKETIKKHFPEFT